MKKKQLLIASDQFLSRLGVKTLLSVVGIDSDIQETHCMEGVNDIITKEQDLDFIIISSSILVAPKNKCILELKRQCSNCKFMLIGDHIIDDLNCDQFVLNSYQPKLVLEKFQNFFAESENENKRSESSVLSEREIEVLKTIALGLSNKLIADQLCISVHTVVTHRKNITSKLGIKSISGLTVYALLNNIIQAEDVK